MLLSKIPVLDKGYVALISSCNTTKTLREIDKEFFGGRYPLALEELGSMTIAIKCPLFVQLNLSKFQFKIITADSGGIDAFLPNDAQVSSSREHSKEIATNIATTTDALIYNHRALRADGAHDFISQLLTPINVYTTLIVSGSYKEWCAFGYEQKNAPGPIVAYTMAVQQIIESEWI